MPYEWDSLMKQWNAFLLASPKARIDDSVRSGGWLGFPPATPAEIGALEERLGAALPPSYREFLAFSNGWRVIGPFIYELWGTEKVEWFAVRNQEWIDAYTIDDEYPVSDERYFVYGTAQDGAFFRTAYLRSALEVSDTGDSAILLLNPKVVFDGGEWEAWFFANWIPGAHRYRSFWELMTAEYESARRLL